MATKKRKPARRRATQGLGYLFHGAFKSKAAAEKKAKARGGFLLKRRGRYVVMTERAPF